ncbi:MAG TPA: hypothetical protein VGB32_03970 [Candidatus Bathyarchaeia archaeon]
MNRPGGQILYATVLLLASVIVFGVASPGSLSDEPSSYVYDVRIETDRDVIRMGESFTATVYLCNQGDGDILLEPIRQFTFSGNSVFDPEPVSCVVNADYPGGTKIRIGAHDRAVFLRQTFTPEYPGLFTITCLSARKTVTITGYKEVTLNSTGISLVIEPSHTDLKDRNYVEFNLVIKNDNPYPVKVPVFNKLSYSLTPDSPIGTMYIDWIWRYFEIEAESQRTVWKDSFLVRYPSFSLYYYVDGVTASLEIGVKK